MSDPSYANSPQNAVPGPLNGQQYRFAPTYIRGRNPTTADLRPKENQGYYPVGSFWVNTDGPLIFVLLSIDSVNFVTVANWVALVDSSGAILTISDNANTAVDPSSSSATPPDNIQLTGQLNEQSGSFSTVVANAASNLIKFNPMSSARWIVDPLSTTPAPNGTHTTIQSAINSAANGDTILVMPGTYTENLNLDLFAGTSLVICGLSGDTNVTITGKATLSTAKSITFSNLILGNTADNCIAISGSAASNMRLEACTLSCNNAPGISFTSSSASSNIFMYNSGGDCAGTASIFSHSSAGALNIFYCLFSASGGATVSANTASAGVLNIFYTAIFNRTTISGTVGGTFEKCDFDTVAPDTNAFTSSSSGLQTFRHCSFSSNNQPAFTCTSPATVSFHQCALTANNAANACTGNGTINYSDISGTSNLFAGTLTVQSLLSAYAPKLIVNNLTGVYSGSGSPNGVLTAAKGSLYLRSDGSGTTDRAFINTDSGTTWTAITTVA